MSAPSRIKEFHVDPSRLASGTWCHARDKVIGEGDINASYSADLIAMKQRVRSPFTWKNTMWVCTGIVSRGEFRAAEAYTLLPQKFFDGTPISYHENVAMGDAARKRADGFYHGMAVKRGKQDFVLVGPSAVFLPAEEIQVPRQADLFDGL